MDCITPGFPVLHHLLELAQTHVHRVSDAIQPSHPLSSPSPPAFSLSQHQWEVMSSLHIRRPKYWSFSFSISPSNEYLGLTSFRMDLFDLLAVQRTLKSLLQHHNSKASILQHSVFMVQLSHTYMTIGKTIALTIWTFISKVMSLLLKLGNTGGNSRAQEMLKTGDIIAKLISAYRWYIHWRKLIKLPYASAYRDIFFGFSNAEVFDDLGSLSGGQG